jgi:small GTP-binding protein
MGILEKIAEIELEIQRTQINKATEHHYGLLKMRLAKYRADLLAQQSSGGGGGGPHFDVARTGDARVCLFGFPSVGKSSLMSKITDYESPVGDYDFTTVTAIPAILEVNGVKIQLLDLPGIVKDAHSGLGRGKEVLGVVRSCDLVVFVITAAEAETQIGTLNDELQKFGIRVNQTPPDVTITHSVTGGRTVDKRCSQTHLNDEDIKTVMNEAKFRSGHVTISEDITMDRLFDAFNQTHLKYMPAIYVYNKIDTLTMEQIDRLARQENSVVTSVIYDLNLDEVAQMIYSKLDIVRVYTKPPGKEPDLKEAVLLRKGATVQDLCMKLHKDMASRFRSAEVWGSSVKRMAQQVGKDHVLDDEDVITIRTNK